MWEPKASKALWERAGFAAGSHRDSTFHRSSPPQFSRALSILASHSRAGSSSSRLGEAIGGGSLLLDQSPVWWVLFTLSKSGEVESVRIITDRETGRSRGFGFVEMSEENAAKVISQFNETELDGRALTVNGARPQVNREGGGYSRY